MCIRAHGAVGFRQGAYRRGVRTALLFSLELDRYFVAAHAAGSCDRSGVAFRDRGLIIIAVQGVTAITGLHQPSARLTFLEFVAAPRKPSYYAAVLEMYSAVAEISRFGTSEGHMEQREPDFPMQPQNLHSKLRIQRLI